MNKNISFHKNIILLCLMLLPFMASAQGEFKSLSPDVQTTLSPFKERWSGMDSTKQQKLIKGAQRWNKLNTEQQQTAKRRYQSFRKLPEAQRAQAVSRMESYSKLSPEKRSEVLGDFKAYKSMDAKQQKKLQQRFMKEKNQRPQENSTRSKSANMPRSNPRPAVQRNKPPRPAPRH